jgi:hypothetical protein
MAGFFFFLVHWRPRKYIDMRNMLGVQWDQMYPHKKKLPPCDGGNHVLERCANPSREAL